MANTTWSTTAKTNVTLSGGNLIATPTTNPAGVRTIDAQFSGKFYWEITATAWNNAAHCVGIASPTYSQTIPLWNVGTTGSVALLRSGAVGSDGVNTGISFGTITSGTVICFAFDLNARLVWIRLGAAGSWNTSASANPATGVGGFTTTSIGQGIPAYPAASFNAAAGENITANFGDTAFTGAAPSGFTSGFTAGATINTNALATQLLAEHWLTTNPNSQVTQVAFEHWATVTTTGLQALVTQVALEQWATVAVALPDTTQARVMVMA